jgi:hypothetical protein
MLYFILGKTLSLTEKIQQLKPYSALLQGNLMGLEKWVVLVCLEWFLRGD